MLCDKCKKNPANVHVSRIINGVKYEQNICSECAGMQAGNIFSDFEDMFRSFREMSLVSALTPSRLLQRNIIQTGDTAFEALGLKLPDQTQTEEDKPLLQEIDVPLLKKRLDEALLREDYEEAAQLRDKIYKLEKKIKNQED